MEICTNSQFQTRNEFPKKMDGSQQNAIIVDKTESPCDVVDSGSGE